MTLISRVMKLFWSVVWMLPASTTKNRVLTLAGNDIAASARIGPTVVVGCGPITVGAETVIGLFNVFRGLRVVRIGRATVMGQLNYVGAAREFQALHPDSGAFYVGDVVAITNRHYFDCSGVVDIGDRVVVGGLRSIFQTHEADLATNTQTAGRITLCEGSMTATDCTLLKGATVPYRSMVAAGSLMRAKPAGAEPDPESHLLVGRPATAVKALHDMAYWTRADNCMRPRIVEI